LADAEAIATILQASRGSGSDPGAPGWSLAQVSAELKVGRGLGFFLPLDGGDAGLAAFLLWRELSGTGGTCEISYLATAPRQRRKGLMSRLMQDFLAVAPSNGESGGEVWLEAHQNNQAARALYARFAFREVGLRARYYADGGTAILYSLSRGKP
jgi:ribosomal-protein-alanine N-acetyltransferase